MAEKATKAKQVRRSVRASFPEGLDSVSVTLRYQAAEKDFKALRSSLGGLPGFWMRSDNRAVRGAIKHGRLLQSGHAHLDVVHVEKDEQVVIELELLPGLHGTMPKKTSVLEDAIDRLAALLPPQTESRRAVVGGNFTFDLKRWEPTVTLPFSTPGAVESMPGLPQICGLEFAFTERTDTQPLHRAFITTYAGVNRMLVRLLLFLTVEWDRSLPQRAIDSVCQQLPVFVRRKDGAHSHD